MWPRMVTRIWLWKSYDARASRFLITGLTSPCAPTASLTFSLNSHDRRATRGRNSSKKPLRLLSGKRASPSIRPSNSPPLNANTRGSSQPVL